jgi:hypothetical protein
VLFSSFHINSLRNTDLVYRFAKNLEKERKLFLRSDCQTPVLRCAWQSLRNNLLTAPAPPTKLWVWPEELMAGNPRTGQFVTRLQTKLSVLLTVCASWTWIRMTNDPFMGCMSISSLSQLHDGLNGVARW